MSIELNCPNCEHTIRAPDDAGGKHGKCPYCQTKVYIPAPVSDADIIPLAPIDEADEERERQLHREAVRYAASFDKEGEGVGGAEGRGAAARKSGPGPAAAPGEVVDLPAEVERYVVAMRDSKLDDAERVASKLKRSGSRARDYVEGLMLDPTPPPIGNVPRPLLNGFLKSLAARLS